MAVERVYMVNGQEVIPANRVAVLQSGPRYYYTDPAAIAPVEIVQTSSPPQTVYYMPGYNAMPPIVPVIYQPGSHNGGYLLIAAMLLLALMMVGLLTVVLMAWMATGRWL